MSSGNSIFEQSKIFKVILSNSSDGVELLCRDLASNAVVEYYVNDKFLDLFKRSYDDLLNMKAYKLSPEIQPNGTRSREALVQHYDKLVKHGHVEYDWTFEDKNGKLFHTEVSIVGYKDKMMYVAVALFRNKTQQVEDAQKIKQQIEALSEQKIKMEKYIESNMQLENFAYMASHDLKTPLRNIVSFSQLLENSVIDKLSDAEKEYLYFIKTGAKNMDSLISGLLHYAKYEYKELNKVEIEVADVIKNVTKSLEDEIEKHQARINFDGLPKFIVADKATIFQLFYQLIKNAIYYKNEKRLPEIRVSYIASTTKHQFNIQDNGIGIDKNYYDRVFLLFKKLNTSEKHSSAGIGLAICKKIVELHQGNIWLD